MTTKIIKAEKTAITNGISNSCKMIAKTFLNDMDNFKILDYGCGKLRNSKHLISLGYNVSVIDTKTQIENNLCIINDLGITNYQDIESINFENKYNVVLSSFVLNVIADIKDRNLALSNIHNLLDDDGVAYLEVRNEKFLKDLKTKIEYNDGVLTGSGKHKTFQKPYTTNEFVEYISSNNFEIIETKKTANSIIVVAKKVV